MIFYKLIVSSLFLVLISKIVATEKGNDLKEIGWDQIVTNPSITKHFASDVEEIRKTDLEQVISDFHAFFGGGYSHSIFVTGASSAAYQPLLSTAASIFGYTPQLGSYLSSVGIDANDPKDPQFVIFIEKESMDGHEHQLAVFAHEYYHIYQNAPLLDQPESAKPYTWVMEGAAALIETLYVKSTPNNYPYKQENLGDLLALTKDYYDQYPDFNFGTEQETHEGINPEGMQNYNLATVAMTYLCHLTNFRKALWPDWYSLAYNNGFAPAFTEHFGMSKSQFYNNFNNFIRYNSKETILEIEPKTYQLDYLLAEPDLDDNDSDGLSNYDEIVRYGTSISSTDSDTDGFSDGREVELGLNPSGTISSFENSEYVAFSWKKLPDFGSYFEELSPWYYHQGMGWFYSSNLDISDFWFYLPDFGWCWSNNVIFPYIYENSKENWLFFNQTSEDTFYRYGEKTWTPVD